MRRHPESGASRGVRAIAVAAAGIAALLLSGCAAAAASAPQGTPATVLDMDAVLGIPYTTAGTETLELDVYLPDDGDEPRGAVVLLHGGGFVGGERDTGGMQRIAQQIVKLGYVAASIDYSLAPGVTYPAPVDETLAAVEFLREPDVVERFDLDPDRIALFGSSAGATIALQAGVQPQDDTRIAAVVSLSGASVLDESALSLGTPGSDEVKSALAYLGCADVRGCAVGTDASPALHVTAESSPMLIANGVGEIIPQEHAERMAAALSAAGVPVELEIVPKAAHAAELLSASLWSLIADFLAAHLDAEGSAP